MINEKARKRNKGYYASLRCLSLFAVLISLVALFAIIIFIFVRGAQNLSINFLFGEYGDKASLWPAIIGTLHLILIALAIGMPLGVATAIYLVEYAKGKGFATKIIKIAIETLASIPSVVYGLFGYLVFVVSFGLGYSLLGGGLTLSIMILPLIVKSVEEALKEVPSSLREASLALGASKIRTIFRIVLPSALPGILTSAILSIGRVVSESAVLLLTIGMVVNLVPENALSAGTSLALDIYYFASFGYIGEAGAASLTLLLLVFVLNLSAYGLTYFFQRRKGNGK